MRIKAAGYTGYIGSSKHGKCCVSTDSNEQKEKHPKLLRMIANCGKKKIDLKTH